MPSAGEEDRERSPEREAGLVGQVLAELDAPDTDDMLLCDANELVQLAPRAKRVETCRRGDAPAPCGVRARPTTRDDGDAQASKALRCAAAHGQQGRTRRKTQNAARAKGPDDERRFAVRRGMSSSSTTEVA